MSKGLEFVAALGAAFGGFLLDVAPPDETGVKFAVGISSFLMLLAFLFVAALTQREAKSENRKYWFIAAGIATALFVGSAFTYRHNFESLTFLFPPDDEDQVRYVNGTELTKEGRARLDKAPNSNRAELLAPFGENRRQAVWAPSSIDRANTILVVNYVIVVLTITLALLCLIEGILQRTNSPPVSAASNEPAVPTNSTDKDTQVRPTTADKDKSVPRSGEQN